MNAESREIRHWTDEELIDRLYGVGPETPAELGHLASCGDCGVRWQSVQERRSEAILPPSVSEGFLRAQRQRIHARIENPGFVRSVLRPVPALATVLLVAMGWMLQRPDPPKPEPRTAVISDTQLFTEIASAVDQEPRAADPIHSLFTESQPE
jgi:hypothetical protein